MSKLFRSLLLLALLFSLAGCQPTITASTDPRDSDFSTFHPEVVTGEGFTIQPDVHVFTLYAFLNGVAGWDEELGDGFTPERQALRKALEERLAAVDPAKVSRWRKFYEDHPQHTFGYLYYTMSLGTPPDFDYIVPMNENSRSGMMRSLDGFHAILSDFYIDAGLQDLYEDKFREMMMEYVRAYDAPAISAQVKTVYEYTRLDPEKVANFDLVIVPNPFASHYTAMSIGFQKRLYIVDGPGSNSSGLNVHEYLYMLMDEILPADLGGQESKFNALLKENLQGEMVKGNYEETHIFVEEALVRAIDYRIRRLLEPGSEAMARQSMADDVAGGLVLVDDFYQALPAYEQDSSFSLRDFINETLQTIPAEQQR